MRHMRTKEEVFRIVAPEYDRATRLLSWGQDARWKKLLIESLPVMKAPRCLDLACGSGDLAEALAKKYPKGEILGVDLTPGMIERARARTALGNLSYAVMDMCDLTGIPTGCIDIVTGGYALRNAQNLPMMLSEVSRVLKPNGYAAFLEFCNAESSGRRRLHRMALHTWGSLVGLWLHRDADVYRYIPRSLQRFPRDSELSRLMGDVCLGQRWSRSFMLGLMEVSLWQKEGQHTAVPTICI